VLASCAAFESYCKVYTADLKPDSMAEFLLLNPEFSVFRTLCGRTDGRGDCGDFPDVSHKCDRPDRTYYRTATCFPRLRTDCRHQDRPVCTVTSTVSSSNAAACIQRCKQCISTIRSSQLWRLDVLRCPAFHSFSVQLSGLAECNGIANAAAQRRNTQRCFTFQLSINPQARVFSYQDHFAIAFTISTLQGSIGN